MRNYLKSLEAAGKKVVWLGDLNVVHEEIDIHTLRGNEQHAGCTPRERQSFSDTLEKGFVDSFRWLYPDRQTYSWFSMKNLEAR